MDQYHNYKQTHNPNDKGNTTNSSNRVQNISGYNNSPANSNANTADNANGEIRSQPNTHVQRSDTFTMITPNESRRAKLTMIAQKEEEDLQRWKESRRLTSVNLPPEKLGGIVSLDDARERQRQAPVQSKLQQKMKRDDLDKKRRQEEAEELDKMKAMQREKAEHLEKRGRQDDQRRKQQFKQHQERTNDSYLQRLEQRSPAVATHTSPSSEALEENHRRVNMAFLDKLERGNPGPREEGEVEREPPQDHLRTQESHNVQTRPSDPDMQPSASCKAEEADAEYEWAITKLENTFPECSRIFLEDILTQCSRDYQQAHLLLRETLG